MLRKRRILSGTAVLLLLLLVVFHSFWLTRIGSFLIYQDKIEPADAVLVLGGGGMQRVAQGIDLCQKKYGDRLMFTGEWDTSPLFKHNNWAYMAQYIAVSRYRFPRNKIILILNPKSTYDDALQSKAVCLQNNFKSIIVTSDPYHTRRAYLTFTKVYRGSGVKMMFYPVQNSWYTSENWWKSKRCLDKTCEEYAKLAYYLFCGRLI